MEAKAKPVCGRGERNVFCPHYSACLDHAVKHSWDYWVCCDCPHKSVQQPVLDVQSLVDSSVIYYTLPAQIRRRVREEFN